MILCPYSQRSRGIRVAYATLYKLYELVKKVQHLMRKGVGFTDAAFPLTDAGVV